ncbi:hypothetical protein [Actinomadura nitritigenes]|uniref:hypothetical protein n=1 Tax=Actinomadura nitritigenes TaxID=134602 RepID=UPI003D92AE64
MHSPFKAAGKGAQDTQATRTDEPAEQPDQQPDHIAAPVLDQADEEAGEQEQQHEEYESAEPVDRTRVWYAREVGKAKSEVDLLAMAVDDRAAELEAARREYSKAREHLMAVESGFNLYLRQGQVLRPGDIVSGEGELGMVLGATAIVPEGTSRDQIAEYEATMRALRDHATFQLANAQNRLRMGPVPVDPAPYPQQGEPPQSSPPQQGHAGVWPQHQQGQQQGRPYPLAGSQALHAPPSEETVAMPVQPVPQPGPVGQGEPLRGPEGDAPDRHGDALGKAPGAR